MIQFLLELVDIDPDLIHKLNLLNRQRRGVDELLKMGVDVLDILVEFVFKAAELFHLVFELVIGR